MTSGRSVSDFGATTDAKAMNKERTIRKLTQLKIEEPGIVAKVKLPAPEAARLDELGLHVGSSVRVLSGAAGVQEDSPQDGQRLEGDRNAS